MNFRVMTMEHAAEHLAVRRESGSRVGAFVLAILGFSFWFLLAVPFRSHRESYSWLADVGRVPLTNAVSFISVTYRPFAQFTTWLGFEILDPKIFPTSIFRQAALQGAVYTSFIVAWWYIVSAAIEVRLFSVVAFVVGGVFFPGYVHLFHIYGLFYAPVMLILGALLCFNRVESVDSREIWLACAALLLIFWHPFASALFLGFYFGRYIDTFRRRTKLQRLAALGIMSVFSVALLLSVVVFARSDVSVPLHTKLFGWLVTYRTNEVNVFASLCAFLLTEVTIFSMGLTRRATWICVVLIASSSACFLEGGLPLLLLWLLVVQIKLARLRCWSLFFLSLTAVLIPIGGVIGSPVFGLFAIIVAAYVTAYGWTHAEEALAFLKTRHIVALAAVAVGLVALMRTGIDVPVVSKAAHPLLMERERTYQLEDALAWLHNSRYCSDEVAFANNAGDPIDSVDNALSRKDRPPAGIDDVRHFWDERLRCTPQESQSTGSDSVILTFGGETLNQLEPIYRVGGKYAGEAIVWVPAGSQTTTSAGGQQYYNRDQRQVMR